jgi:hypothetical protein
MYFPLTAIYITDIGAFNNGKWGGKYTIITIIFTQKYLR